MEISPPTSATASPRMRTRCLDRQHRSIAPSTAAAQSASLAPQTGSSIIITAVYMDSFPSNKIHGSEGFSGQYHQHPYGEINCVTPIDASAELKGDAEIAMRWLDEFRAHGPIKYSSGEGRRSGRVVLL